MAILAKFDPVRENFGTVDQFLWWRDYFAPNKALLATWFTPEKANEGHLQLREMRNGGDKNKTKIKPKKTNKQRKKGKKHHVKGIGWGILLLFFF